MTGPAAPRGAVAAPARRLDHAQGEVARWKHADDLPALWLYIYGPARDLPARVKVAIWPGPLTTTDPGDLRQMAWALLAAAAWQERQQDRPPAEPDPQLSIYDFEAHA